jgi:hypothetical protein
VFPPIVKVTALTALDNWKQVPTLTTLSLTAFLSFLSGKWALCEGGLFGNNEYEGCHAPHSREVKAGIPCSSGAGRRGFDTRQFRRTKRAWRLEMKFSPFTKVAGARIVRGCQSILRATSAATIRGIKEVPAYLDSPFRFVAKKIESELYTEQMKDKASKKNTTMRVGKIPQQRDVGNGCEHRKGADPRVRLLYGRAR